MTGVEITLVVTTLLVSLVAGFVFGFAVVAMPGIRKLDDGAFIRAFQVMDGVIQANQPLFMLVWVGSVLSVIASMGIAVSQMAGLERTLVLAAGAIYLVGVQLPTGTINVPLNNVLQRVDVEASGPDELEGARAAFEARWNRWNAIRTGFACLTAVVFLVVLARV